MKVADIESGVFMEIGNKIVYLREKRGWSQRELARRVNLNASVMNRIESGDRPIKDHELAKISNVLEVSSDYLLGIKNDDEKVRKSFDFIDKLESMPEEKRDVYIEIIKRMLSE